MSEQILHNLSISVLSVDQQLTLCFINQSAENLLEISGKRAINQHISDILLNTDELETILLEALDTGQLYTRRKVKLDLITGHSITCDYAVTPINDEDSIRLLIELYPLDRYLRIDRDETIASHQEITRQMIRGLAHEIKNPLGGIRGSAQLLAREFDDNQLDQYTDIIIDETDRLTSLVDRLLGPKIMPNPSLVNIHEVLERVRKLIELESDPPITIYRAYDPSIPELNVDAELMVQVFLNIARNAMQSLAETQSPSLQFASRIERQYIIGTRQHKVVVRLDIKDNGPGIPPDLRDHLFYPMISGRSEGSGLGLSVAQSIVHQHHGFIEFESEAGDTVFSIFLPLEPSL
ncbi:MAG: nitrogen regulation protein NR(II) [Pseudomonadales bacterium]|nr:nitrogen regulation protein NR(II) [Pseudomonadales bacterium]